MAPLLDLLRPGMRIFAAGSAGEPIELLEAIAADPDRFHGLDIVTSAVPGINRFDYAALAAANRVTGPFMLPGLGEAQRQLRFRQLPTSYSGFVQMLDSDERPFDLVVAHVAPSSAGGRASMGVAVEFLPVVLRRARTVAAIVNHRMPALAGAPAVDLAACAATIEVDRPLPTYEIGDVDGISDAIAGHLAPLIGDDACLQVGLGKIPTALLGRLGDRRGLRLHSGMLSDGVRALVEAGALATDPPPASCVLVGSQPFYAWAQDQDAILLRGCEWTHAPLTLAGLEPFFAVNSAVEVDLFGQAALEFAGGSAISGAGGAPDFARAARLSRRGASIVALPATAARGAVSRIVAQLQSPGVASLPRSDVDAVGTEFGTADLRACSVFERAERLIEVAHPDFRPDLRSRWKEMACRL